VAIVDRFLSSFFRLSFVFLSSFFQLSRGEQVWRDAIMPAYGSIQQHLAHACQPNQRLMTPGV
jgi:hypothetical protein